MAILRDIEGLGKQKSTQPAPIFCRLRGPCFVDEILSITAYLRRMSRPIVSTLDSKNESSFKSTDEVVLVANLVEGDQELEDRFMEVAREYRDRYSFAVRRRKAHGVSVDCVNNVNFAQFSISDLSDPLAVIHNLIRQCSMPAVPAFTRRNEGELSQVGPPFPFPTSDGRTSIIH